MNASELGKIIYYFLLMKYWDCNSNIEWTNS
jgi:hypothetical protein